MSLKRPNALCFGLDQVDELALCKQHMAACCPLTFTNMLCSAVLVASLGFPDLLELAPAHSAFCNNCFMPCASSQVML